MTKYLTILYLIEMLKLCKTLSKFSKILKVEMCKG